MSKNTPEELVIDNLDNWLNSLDEERYLNTLETIGRYIDLEEFEYPVSES